MYILRLANGAVDAGLNGLLVIYMLNCLYPIDPLKQQAVQMWILFPLHFHGQNEN